MEVPALMTLLFGVAVIGAFFILRIPIFVLGVLSLILLGITVYYHINQFSLEYRSMTLGDGIKSMAPTILVGAVIVMSVIYILMLSPGRPIVPYGAHSTPGFFSRLFGPRVRAPAGYAQPTKPGIISSLFGSSGRGPSPSSPSAYGNPGARSNSDRRAYVSALDRLI